MRCILQSSYGGGASPPAPEDGKIHLIDTPSGNSQRKLLETSRKLLENYSKKLLTRFGRQCNSKTVCLEA